MSPKANPDVMAVVVTYGPGAELGANLEAIRDQAGAVVVVDNGSANAAWVERTARAGGCRFIGNDVNLGIATALNQGVRMARTEGFAWLATFDQDSLIAPGALAGLLAIHESHPQRERIAILAMSHRDRATQRAYHQPWDILEETPIWRSLRATITSGSLTPLWVFDKVGMFDDRLFIDSVDHEFCLRCRRDSLLVIEARSQAMDHSIGAITEHNFLWRRVACTNHSPTRRYYMTRNQIEVYGRHLFTDFRWSALGLYYLAVSSVIVLVLERDRWAKLGAMLEGARDVLLRRFGPRGR
jgi:rhamnosyltransferase